MNLIALTIAALSLSSVESIDLMQPAPETRQRLAVFGGAGYIGSTDAGGAAITLGARSQLARHFALSFDLGYGLIGRENSKQDRWWLMPSAALVLPVGKVRLDIGAGLGLGTCSGYPTWAAFGNAPFTPAWAFQLAPAVRGHVMAAWTVSPRVDLFARVEVASLILGGNKIGIRDGNPNPGLGDTTWANLWLGVQFGLL